MFHIDLFVCDGCNTTRGRVCVYSHAPTNKHTNMSVVEYIGPYPHTRTFLYSQSQPSAIQYMSDNNDNVILHLCIMLMCMID